VTWTLTRLHLTVSALCLSFEFRVKGYHFVKSSFNCVKSNYLRLCVPAYLRLCVPAYLCLCVLASILANKMPGPSNNKKKASKKPATALCTATNIPMDCTTDVPVNISTCEDAYLVAADAFLHAADQTKALRMLWEMAYGLGDLNGLEEGKEKGLEEGRKLGLDEGRNLGLEEGRKLGIEEGKRYYMEGDLTRAFNRGIRQGKADEKNRWVEAGHREQDKCARDSCSFASIGVGPDATSATRTFVDIGIGPDVESITRTFVDVEIGPGITGTTTNTHELIGMQKTVDKSLATSTRFSWADDAASIPIISSSMPTLASRDFSALRSQSKTPFGTLQRRYQRSRGIRRTRQYFRTLPAQRTYSPWLQHNPPPITCYHPSGIRPGRHAITTPIHSVSTSHLDWDQDPRLHELGRVLGTLGWVRQDQFS
jgi:hypothetical protein